MERSSHWCDVHTSATCHDIVVLLYIVLISSTSFEPSSNYATLLGTTYQCNKKTHSLLIPNFNHSEVVSAVVSYNGGKFDTKYFKV